MKHTFLILLFALAGCSSTPKDTTPDFIHQFSGPPAVGTVEDEADYDALMRLQKFRTPKDCTRAASEVHISLASYYGLPYGILTEAEVARLTPFFEEASQSAWKLIGMAKKKWKRVRPYDAHVALNPCIQKETSFSYPSGHSAMSRFYYLILVNFYPAQQETLLKRSDEIATDRTIGGVHYVTDINDGKRLGEEIYAYLVKNEKLAERIQAFQQTLKPALKP